MLTSSFKQQIHLHLFTQFHKCIYQLIVNGDSRKCLKLSKFIQNCKAMHGGVMRDVKLLITELDIALSSFPHIYNLILISFTNKTSNLISKRNWNNSNVVNYMATFISSLLASIGKIVSFSYTDEGLSPTVSQAKDRGSSLSVLLSP